MYVIWVIGLVWLSGKLVYRTKPQILAYRAKIWGFLSSEVSYSGLLGYDTTVLSVKTISKEHTANVPKRWRQYASPVCWLPPVRLHSAIHNVNITLWIYIWIYCSSRSRGGWGWMKQQQLFVLVQELLNTTVKWLMLE
jgi:hypothetical protein